VFRDFKIYLLDNSVKSARLPEKIDAEHLRNGIAAMLQIPEESNHLFAIWIVSPSLQIQMKDKQEPFKELAQCVMLLPTCPFPLCFLCSTPPCFPYPTLPFPAAVTPPRLSVFPNIGRGKRSLSGPAPACAFQNGGMTG
jgi:hypothetical protein